VARTFSLLNNNGHLPIDLAVSCGKSEVSKYLLREFYATIHRLPLHELLKDLTWIGDLNSNILDVAPLRAALHRNVLGTEDVVDILEYLVDRKPELISSRDQDGSRPLHEPVVAALLSRLFSLWSISIKPP
jgi:hypothetical protein